MHKLFYCFLFITLLAGCAKKINPVQPPEFYNKVEVTKELSTINIPISYPIAELQKQLNNEVKGVLFESAESEGENIRIKVTKSNDIKLQVKDEILETAIPIKVMVNAGFAISHFGLKLSSEKDIEFELIVKYKTNIIINPNWSVSSKTTGDGFTWISKPILKIGFINLPVTAIVERILKSQQSKVAENMDSEIKKNFNIKKYAEAAWINFQNPVLLSSKFNTWLKMTPKEVMMSPFHCKNDVLNTCIAFSTYLETSIGDKPASSLEKLQDLKLKEVIDNSYSLKLLAMVTHANATKIAQNNFLGKTFTFKDNKYAVKIEEMELYGNGPFLVIKTKISGSLNGTLFLKGIPYYNSEKKVIALNDLDFDLDTKNKIAKTANWMSHGTLVKKIQSSFVIPVEEQIKQAKTEMSKYLSNYKVNNYMTLNGDLEEITPEKITIQPDCILVQLGVTGHLDVKLNSYSKP